MTFTIPDGAPADEFVSHVFLGLAIVTIFLTALYFFLTSCNDSRVDERDATIEGLREQVVERDRLAAEVDRHRLAAEGKATALEDQIAKAAVIFGWADGDDDADDEDDEVIPAAAPAPPVGDLYACSFVSWEDEKLRAFLIRAVSKDEAHGKADRVARKHFPDGGYDLVVTGTVVELPATAGA